MGIEAVFVACVVPVLGVVWSCATAEIAPGGGRGGE